MPWQDVVLAVGNLVFALALIPSIRSKDKPHLQTSLMTASVLTIFAAVYTSLHLYLAVGMVVLSAVAWYTLAYQKWQQQK